MIAVYGTLKRGRGNHYFLGNSEFMGNDKIAQMDMFSAGGFPYASPGEGVIDVELYNVSPEVEEDVDGLEGYPGWYDKIKMTTMKGKNVSIYVMYDVGGSPKIESGCW